MLQYRRCSQENKSNDRWNGPDRMAEFIAYVIASMITILLILYGRDGSISTIYKIANLTLKSEAFQSSGQKVGTW
jgi:hypothetical protein